MNRVDIPAPPDGAQDGCGASHARRLDFALAGISGMAGSRSIERALLASAGVLSASVNPTTERARVLVGRDGAEGDAALAARLQAAVATAGYAATVITPEPSSPRDTSRRGRLHLLLACLLTVPLLASTLWEPLSVLLHQHRPGTPAGLPGWAQFLLATPVQFWLGRELYRAAWAGLRDRVGNAAQLAALGSSAAWAWSATALLLGSHRLYFAVGGLIVTAMLGGDWLEQRARQLAMKQLRPPPETATRRDPGGAEQEVPVADLRTGDLLVVRPGSCIAADGIVRDGDGHVDESLLGSARRIVPKARGEPAFAGSLAADGVLIVEVLAVRPETRLAAITRSIGPASDAGMTTRRLIDQVGGVAALIVLGTAVLTLLGWWAMSGDVGRSALNAASVLVIGCPCAFGLAAAASIALGTGAAARAGILVRDPGCVEQARGIGIVALDKTGALTEARAAIERVVPAGGAAQYAEAAELLSLAAAMQAGSDHPLAVAVRASSGHAVTAPAERVRVLPGRGVAARIGDRSLLLGSRRMIQEEGLLPSAQLADAAGEAEAEGGTVAFLAERRPPASGGSRILGLLGFTDMVAPGAAEAVARLRGRGLMTVLLTADGEGAARRVATIVGVDRLLSGLSPGDKAVAVRTLAREAQGSERPRVAMVGSDAAALAASDLGIGIVGAGRAAIDAASIVMLRRDPGLIADAVEIAGLIAARVREGVYWAFAVNAAGVGLAAAGLLSPSLAVGAAVLSSAGVAISSLRLRNWRPADAAPPGDSLPAAPVQPPN